MFHKLFCHFFNFRIFFGCFFNIWLRRRRRLQIIFLLNCPLNVFDLWFHNSHFLIIKIRVLNWIWLSWFNNFVKFVEIIWTKAPSYKNWKRIVRVFFLRIPKWCLNLLIRWFWSFLKNLGAVKTFSRLWGSFRFESAVKFRALSAETFMKNCFLLKRVLVIKFL